MRSLFVISLLLVAALPAHAQKVSEAREHYDAGTAAYALGDYAKAAAEYEKAFSLRPGPALLYNSAQAHRLAGNKERALLLYQNYLRIYRNESNADEVRRLIANLQRAIETDRTTQSSPPTTTKPIAPSGPETSPMVTGETATPTATTPQSAPVSVVATPSTEDKPLVKKPWFWVVVGGAALVVAGVAIGVGVGVGGQDKNPTPGLGAVSGN